MKNCKLREIGAVKDTDPKNPASFFKLISIIKSKLPKRLLEVGMNLSRSKTYRRKL